MPRVPASHLAVVKPLFLTKSSTIGALILPLPGSNLTKTFPNQPFCTRLVSAMFKEIRLVQRSAFEIVTSRKKTERLEGSQL